MGYETCGESAPPPSGGLIRLQAHAGDLGSWLGPTWAALCGVLAAGRPPWSGATWLRLALLLFLVDGGWGTVWAALASTNWASPLRRWTTWDKNKSVAALPYTLPGTPGDHISRGMGRLATWWRRAVSPTCGPAVRAVLIALPLTALVGTLLGAELLLLSLAALALMQLAVIWEGGHGTVPPGWDAFVAVALPWLAGHTTFGSVTLSSLAMGVLFAFAWGQAWRAPARGAGAVLVGSQLLAAAWLVALHRPLAAGFVALALVPQMALLPWMELDLTLSRFVRCTRPWLMAAMVIAALAL